MKRHGAVACLVAALSACSAGPSYVPSGNPQVSAPPPQTAPANDTFRAPQVMRGSGVDSVIGARADRLLERLGEARIDLVEGDARKLQFAGENCVLDIFLYPLNAGGEPVATHVEARLRKGGARIDGAQCLSEIER